jgi:diacylglycerol kinase (ATP)
VSEAPILRNKPTGLRRLWLALGNTGRGLQNAWREEAAFRQELALAALVIPLGLWLGRNGIERFLLVSPMLLILVVELLNSAVEAAIDRIGLERHPLSGQAKDLGSAAVGVAFVILIVSWVLVLGA